MYIFAPTTFSVNLIDKLLIVLGFNRLSNVRTKLVDCVYIKILWYIVVSAFFIVSKCIDTQ